MKLSKSSAHAALALAFLATRNGDGPTQARQVAEHLGIPTDSALKILQALTRNRLIQSQLGRSGGYRLLRAADELSLLEIVEAIDGPIGGAMPVTTPPASAPALGAGPGAAATPPADEGNLAGSIDRLEAACHQAAVSLRAALGRYTVADLLAPRAEPALASA